MNRILSLALACTLALSLTACGGNASSGSASSGSADAASSAGASIPDVSEPDVSTPDASQPDGSTSAEPEATPEPETAVSLSLNKSDFTLKSAGAAYKLKAAAAGSDAPLSWTSSDASVATVAQDGTVTAVAPGKAVITVTCGSLSAQCIVRCNWEEKTEAPGSSAGSSAPSAPSAAQVDLAAFYEEIMASGGENAPAMMELTGESLDNYYPGLSDVKTNQRVVYMPMISAVACEIAMVECADPADADTVKAIFQTRIDAQVDGGAWYPDTIEGWKNNAKIVTNGSYVALFVIPEGLMDAASAFNGLF